MKETYRVSGMTCGGCAKAVGRAVERAGTGLQAQVDLTEGTVRVEGVHEAEALRKAVEAAGYGWHGPVAAG